MIETLASPPSDHRLELILLAQRSLTVSLFDLPWGSGLSDLGVSTAQFRDDKLARAARHALELRRSGVPVDPASVAASLGRTNEIEQAGGLSDLVELANFWVAPENLEPRRQIVRDDWRCRERSKIAAELNAGMVEDAEAANRLRELASQAATHEPQPIGAALAELFIVGPAPVVPFGLSGLDRLDVTAGNLCVVAARPGVGKSALLTTVALNAAAQGWQVLLISLEMAAREIKQRLLAGWAQLPLETVKRADDPALTAAASSLSRLPIMLEAAGQADTRSANQVRVDVLAGLIER